MQRVDGIQYNRGGPSAGQRRSDFLAHIARFANADDNNFSSAFESGNNEPNGLLKRVVKLSPHRLEASYFDIEHFPCPGEMIHPAQVANGARAIQL
jgi:hypothetical protein